jgi:hypothetical protein
MITIDFNSFWKEDDLLKKSTIEFIEINIGEPDKIILQKEIKEDPDSNYSIFFNYKDFHLHGVKEGYFDPNYWGLLKNFSKINEIYVLVYDHDSKIRYGYWYDEVDYWVHQNIGDYKPYIDVL